MERDGRSQNSSFFAGVISVWPLYDPLKNSKYGRENSIVREALCCYKIGNENLEMWWCDTIDLFEPQFLLTFELMQEIYQIHLLSMTKKAHLITWIRQVFTILQRWMTCFSLRPGKNWGRLPPFEGEFSTMLESKECHWSSAKNVVGCLKRVDGWYPKHCRNFKYGNIPQNNVSKNWNYSWEQ